MLEMQKEQLRAKVNAVYGYNAIARVRITQTAATGFAEGKVAFGHKSQRRKPRLTRPCAKRRRERHSRCRTMGCAMPLHVWARTY